EREQGQHCAVANCKLHVNVVQVHLDGTLCGLGQLQCEIDSDTHALIYDKAAATLTATCSSSSFVTLVQPARGGCYVEGRDGGGNFFSASCLCGRRKATQGATGGIC